MTARRYPRHPYLVSLGLFAAAAALVAGYVWIGVL